MQAVRNLFLTSAEALNGCKMLLRDRAGRFTASFDEIFHTEGIRVTKTPPRTPVANCFIERWIGSLRRELLDRTIMWNEPQFRRLVRLLEHYTSTAHTAPSASGRRRRQLRQRSGLATPSSHEPCNGFIHGYRQAA